MECRASNKAGNASVSAKLSIHGKSSYMKLIYIYIYIYVYIRVCVCVCVIIRYFLPVCVRVFLCVFVSLSEIAVPRELPVSLNMQPFIYIYIYIYKRTHTPTERETGRGEDIYCFVTQCYDDGKRGSGTGN